MSQNIHFRIDQKRAQVAIAFLVGFIFSLGLGLSGMADPEKVLGFLTLNENWNPSLIFVMVGAIAFHAFVYRSIRQMKMDHPMLDEKYYLSNLTEITPQLVIGATVFGIGWGIAGICPGPAILAATAGNNFAIIFLPSLIVGMLIHRWYEKLTSSK